MNCVRSVPWLMVYFIVLPGCAVAYVEDGESVDPGIGEGQAPSSGGTVGGMGNDTGGQLVALPSGGSMTDGGGPSLAASGGRFGSGGRTSSGGTGSGAGTCTNIVPTDSDWPQGTCQGWATSTLECDEDWMVNGDDGKGWCNRSCGRCSNF